MNRRLSVWLLASLAIHAGLVAGTLALAADVTPPMLFVDLVHGFRAGEAPAPGEPGGDGAPPREPQGRSAPSVSRPAAPAHGPERGPRAEPPREATRRQPVPPSPSAGGPPAEPARPRQEDLPPAPSMPPVLERAPVAAERAPAPREPVPVGSELVPLAAQPGPVPAEPVQRAPAAPAPPWPSPPGPSEPAPPAALAGGTTAGGVGASPPTVVPLGQGTGVGERAAGGGPAISERGGADAGSVGRGAGARGGSGGSLALVTPGDGSAAGAEYGAYRALVRSRIHELLRYPSIARQRGLSGTVLIEVEIEPTGAIGRVSLAASSSHRVLDEAAIDAARGVRRVPFPPDLRPRALQIRLPVVFDLQPR
jgi:TonB family protein